MKDLKQNGISIDHAAPKLKAEREIVFDALKQNGNSFDHDAPALKAEREIVFDALKQNGLTVLHQSGRRTGRSCSMP